MQSLPDPDLDQGAWEWTKAATTAAASRFRSRLVQASVAVLTAALANLLAPGNVADGWRVMLVAVAGLGGFVLLFGFLFLGFLVVAPYKQRNKVRRILQQEREAAAAARRTALVLKFEPQDYPTAFEQWWTVSYSDVALTVAHFHLYRLCVENTGAETLDDVVVRVVSLSPPITTLLPLTLRLKDEDRGSIKSMGFVLHSGQQEYVQAALKNEPTGEIEIPFVENRPSTFPSEQTYSVVYRAFARNHAPSEFYEVLIYSRTDGTLAFEPLVS